MKNNLKDMLIMYVCNLMQIEMQSCLSIFPFYQKFIIHVSCGSIKHSYTTMYIIWSQFYLYQSNEFRGLSQKRAKMLKNDYFHICVVLM